MQTYAPLDCCPDVQEMVTFLQASAEIARTSLSRELHDEMGGLLVSALMDVNLAEQTLKPDDQLRHRLARVRSTLADAIDFKRKTMEKLRPSILDNFGLFEALRWEIKQQSRIARLPWSDMYPDVEQVFTKEASIVLFRIVQESLIVALRQPSVRGTHIAIETDLESLHMSVSYDGNDSEEALSHEDALAVCSIAYRVHELGGQMTIKGISGGGALYTATLPLARLTLHSEANNDSSGPS
jgi:signal transduction histidine kinase